MYIHVYLCKFYEKIKIYNKYTCKKLNKNK